MQTPLPVRPSSQPSEPVGLHGGQMPLQKMPKMPSAQTHKPSEPHHDGGSHVATLQRQLQSGLQESAPCGFCFSITQVTELLDSQRLVMFNSIVYLQPCSSMSRGKSTRDRPRGDAAKPRVLLNKVLMTCDTRSTFGSKMYPPIDSQCMSFNDHSQRGSPPWSQLSSATSHARSQNFTGASVGKASVPLTAMWMMGAIAEFAFCAWWRTMIFGSRIGSG
mmetsp:Transcript_39788/g.115113  ORF Transcript_39788/g.115113 Transcript_39788/m.115113 type:complete len:219 (-) Transcript_39788:2149-2805(-)